MRRWGGTSRATSTTPARPTATPGSSATPSGLLPPGTSRVAQSSPTTIPLTESAPSSATARRVAPPSCERIPLTTVSMLVLYLHGFASSARSSKATFFGKQFLQEAGIRLETPDFNDPDFSTLTITRMVDQVLGILDAYPDDRAVLIGSSLGAFVAVQVAMARPDRVQCLILLAPA